MCSAIRDGPHANRELYLEPGGGSKSAHPFRYALVGPGVGANGRHRVRPRPAPTPRWRARLVSGPLRAAPFGFTLLAIVLAATAGIVYVISPNWGGQGAEAHNIGTVPDVGGRPVPTVAPRTIRIPRIDAEAPIVRVGTHDRELNIPRDPTVVGWWAGGARPGAHRGTAILAGHVNYAGATGVLSRIGSLHPGDTVYVTGYATGASPHRQVRLRFAVTGVRTYRKTALPYRQIFDQRSVGRLAIVTCGGRFDSSTGNYEDNIVAFAVPTRTA
jgi:hypothetical protein